MREQLTRVVANIQTMETPAKVPKDQKAANSRWRAGQLAAIEREPQGWRSVWQLGRSAVGRKPPGLATNGHKTIHWSGTYAFALQKCCEHALCDFELSIALAEATDKELAAHEAEYRDRLAALVAEWDGQLLR